MSGLEIVGVVLGALPIAVLTLELYEKGAATSKRFMKYEQELKWIALQIRTERMLFDNIMSHLLTEAGVSNVAAMMKDPGGAAWQNTATANLLENRLGYFYALFVEHVSGMNDSMKDVGSALAWDASGKPQFDKFNKFGREFKRLRFALRKEPFEECINKLRIHRAAVESFSDTTKHTPKDKYAHMHPIFSPLRSISRTLYHALVRNLGCTEQQHSHAAQLLLGSGAQKKPFQVIFSLDSSTKWSEVEIECNPTAARSISSTAVTSIPFDTSGFPDHNLRPQSGQTLTITRSLTHASPVQSVSLCGRLSQSDSAQGSCYLGHLLDENFNQSHTVTIKRSYNIPEQSFGVWSLQKLFNDGVPEGTSLSLDNKYRIAAVLSFEILQLHETPWLNKSWGKSDICFFRDPNRPPTDMFNHIFVRQVLQQNAPSNVSQNRYGVIQNESLFNLGVLLIELHYGKSIEDLKIPEDEGNEATPGVRWCTAARITRGKLKDDAGKRYARVVDRCMFCNLSGPFESSEKRFDNTVFLQAVFNDVATPLAEIFRDFHRPLVG